MKPLLPSQTLGNKVAFKRPEVRITYCTIGIAGIWRRWLVIRPNKILNTRSSRWGLRGYPSSKLYRTVCIGFILNNP